MRSKLAALFVILGLAGGFLGACQPEEEVEVPVEGEEEIEVEED